MARKTYTREFKLQALKMLTEQGLSVAEVARRLGVTEGSVRAWREAAGEHGAAAFPGHGNPDSFFRYVRSAMRKAGLAEGKR